MSKMTWARRLRDDRGAAAVEFAIMSIALMILLVGMMETARVVWVVQSLDRATQNVARSRFANTSITNAALATQLVSSLSETGLNNAAESCVSPTSADGLIACVQTETVDGADYLTIKAEYRWEALIPFVPAKATLSRYSRVPL